MDFAKKAFSKIEIKDLDDVMKAKMLVALRAVPRFVQASTALDAICMARYLKKTNWTQMYRQSGLGAPDPPTENSNQQ